MTEIANAGAAFFNQASLSEAKNEDDDIRNFEMMTQEAVMNLNRIPNDQNTCYLTHYVDGEWRGSLDKSKEFEVWNPSTGSVSCKLIKGDKDVILSLYISATIRVNPSSTPTFSIADVSMKASLFSVAYAKAVSVSTWRLWDKSDLLPTNMITMFESAWSLSSFSHLSTFSNVEDREISYTKSAPTAPR